MQQQQQQPHDAPPQFLRVRRRRGAVTVPSRLRLDLDTTQHQHHHPLARPSAYLQQQQQHCQNAIPASLNQYQHDVLAALACVRLEEQQQQQQQQDKAPNQSACSFARQVVFRRVSDPVQACLAAAATATTSTSDDNWIGSRKRRVLDAVILEDEDDVEVMADETENKNAQQQASRKRRKLQLLPAQTSTTTNQLAVEYPVLTPTQCRVDESLKAVFDRSKSLSQHLRDLPENDPNHGWDYYYTWNNCGGLGNWLHAAALWNEVDVVRAELQQPQLLLLRQPPQTTKTTKDHRHWLLPKLLTTRDVEGRTPAQVATLAGHDDLARLLENKLVDCDNNSNNGNEKHGDEYEYDYYCWHPLPAAVTASNQLDCNDSSQPDEPDEEGDEVLDCELHDRWTGYFDASGELVLEPIVWDPTLTEDEDNCAFAGMTSSAALVANGDDDDDHDSNDEDWEGNDYPDEDDWSSSSSSSSSASLDFRQRRVTSYGRDAAAAEHEQYDDEDDAYDTAYDAAYGGIYGQDDNEEYDEEC